MSAKAKTPLAPEIEMLAPELTKLEGQFKEVGSIAESEIQSILSQYSTAIQTAIKLASAAVFVAHYKLILNLTKMFH